MQKNVRRNLLPIVHAGPRPAYDCEKCPSYCCSYEIIEVGVRDVRRLAKHFGLTEAQARAKFTRWERTTRVRKLKHRKDDVYRSVCAFLDRTTRRCTVYEARPAPCRDYPAARRCGYYDFLAFEREHQQDDDFVPLT